MEVVHHQEEFIHNVVKGKRTKRQRPLSPHAFPITTSSSSGGGCASGGCPSGGPRGGGGEDQNLNLSSSSPTTSVDQFSVHSEEEEDMANCLILLAQGGHNNHQYKSKQVDNENGGGGGMERICNRKFVNPTTTTNTSNKGSGLYVYECKTCNRCFPSFQALGGHRASHKRPNKAMVEEKKVSPSSSPFLQVEETHQFNETSLPSLTLQMGNSTHHFHNNISNKSRVHECSICGSEFSSGQALGGHMRRHRASTTTMTSDLSNQHHQEIITKKAKTVLTLDLNLPAPEEDRETNFLFNSKQQKLIFSSTSSLVDCHY